ncbi:MAG TPA: 50S ribosomal protein L10 [Salinivirga sp.]|uniref:50S ribosomal protein L10 n=1 Tax=Salinivirga sp. TaxID=1970192 RepID=UPI002B478EB7|nr:50S ribosomal protein L10 [Salinivirga sp.]HKK58372.1 50S ribosomal protein L10 [Salinivirga sp.]
MKREDKLQIIESLTEKLNEYGHFYLTDTKGLNAEQTSNLRRVCFKNDVLLVVAKNTLLRKAMEKADVDYSEVYDLLKGNTSVMFTQVGNAPGKLMKEFRKKHKKPILKGAFVEEAVYVGDEQLEALANIKSKDELLGDIVSLLQSPAKNVISALQSGGSKIHGVLETLSKK